MKTFDGRGILADDRKQIPVHLTLDLAEYCIKAQYADADLSIHSIFERTASKSDNASGDSVTLLDVEIPTLEGVLKTTRLDELMVASWQSGPGSLGNTGWVTLRLVPRASTVTFEYALAADQESEVVYQGNASLSGRHVYQMDGLELQITGEAPNLKVRSAQPLWVHQRRIGLAASLLLGVRVSPLWAYEAGLMRVNLAKPRDYQSGHRLFREHSIASQMFEELLRFLMRFAEAEFAHWYKAVAFMLEGKSGQSELDIRAVNLLVFLEMLDASRTLETHTLALMLEISESDAELIKRTRNRLIHESDSLISALGAADQELRRWDPKYSLQCFNISGQPHHSALMFSLRLCERINRFILKRANSSLPHYGYEEIIGPQSQRPQSA